jgi:hypothetical protein
MPSPSPILSYTAPSRLKPRPLYIWPLFLASLALAILYFPHPFFMGLLFRVFPFLTVDNAQAPVVILPLVLTFINATALFQLHLTRRRGLVFAALSLSLSLASLLAACFFWIPAFRM